MALSDNIAKIVAKAMKIMILTVRGYISFIPVFFTRHERQNKAFFWYFEGFMRTDARLYAKSNLSSLFDRCN
jgi:hypothetical protein